MSGRSPPTGPTRCEILALQATTRVPDLVPIRYGRMAASPFAFFRGAAAVMAADLAHEVHSHLDVQLCGDAHLVNFGGFASPERDMVFDVNDFDETIPGPFEWDLKRLAASFEVAGRSREFDGAERTSLVALAARGYREAIREFATMRTIEIWYAKLDAQTLVERWGSDVGPKIMETFQHRMAKARTKDHLSAMAKLTEEVDGRLRFVSDPPLLTPADAVFTEPNAMETIASLLGGLSAYRSSLAGDRQHLLNNYEFVDLARKVVGVGSVGTRCWVALFVGRDAGDPLLLQVKQAEEAVGAPFLKASDYDNQGQRVVEGQRLMQSASDIFLGWDRVRGPGRRRPRILRPPALGLEAVCRHRDHAARGVGCLRADVRMDACPCPRPIGGPHRHRLISRRGQPVRRVHVPVRLFVRRPEREGLRGPQVGDRHR